jgi:hypothetical protein
MVLKIMYFLLKTKKEFYLSFNNKKKIIFRLLLFHSLPHFILISLFSYSFSSI